MGTSDAIAGGPAPLAKFVSVVAELELNTAVGVVVTMDGAFVVQLVEGADLLVMKDSAVGCDFGGETKEEMLGPMP